MAVPPSRPQFIVPRYDWHHLTDIVCSAAKLCLTLCDPTGCSPPGSSVHGVFQTRILEWVAISGDLPDPGIEPKSPALQADSLPLSPQGAVKDAEHNPNAQLTIILIDPASSSSHVSCPL